MSAFIAPNKYIPLSLAACKRANILCGSIMQSPSFAFVIGVWIFLPRSPSLWFAFACGLTCVAMSHSFIEIHFMQSAHQWQFVHFLCNIYPSNKETSDKCICLQVLCSYFFSLLLIMVTRMLEMLQRWRWAGHFGPHFAFYFAISQRTEKKVRLTHTHL